MRKIKEILRLKWIGGSSSRQIAKSCNISRSTVQEYLNRAEAAGLTWPTACKLADTDLEDLLYPKNPSPTLCRAPMPPMDYLHRELRRKSVTLQLLWYEYKQEHPDGYQYSFFCEQYRNWAKKLDPPLRQNHLAGEKMFVDFAGQTVDIIDSATGAVSKTHIFIAVLGASNYTYVEAVSSESLPSWINAHIHAFEYFSGVTQIAVPDNLKAGVTHPCRYEPARTWPNTTVQPSFPHDQANPRTKLKWNPPSL